MIDVYSVSLTRPAIAVPTAEELARAARLTRPGAAERWLAARAALRALLAERLETHPDDVTFTAGEHGKPELAGSALRFNLTHSGDLALIAIADGVEVGVDVERTSRSSKAVARTLTAGEQGAHGHEELLRIWCRKEALAKAIGTGLGWAPETFDTSAPGRFELHDLVLVPGYVGALAVEAGAVRRTVRLTEVEGG